MTTLVEKIESRCRPSEVAYFVDQYIQETFSARTSKPVNDVDTLRGEDLFIVNGRIDAYTLVVPPVGASQVCVRDGDLIYASIARDDLSRLPTESLAELIESAAKCLPAVECEAKLFEFIWDVMLASPEMIAADFAERGQRGIEGDVESQSAIRGSPSDVFIGEGAQVHPFACIDATAGPVFIANDVVVQPFTRIEGPAFVGPGSVLLGAKVREGCSIGPMCRIGGEVEASVIHGFSNKYHDGFLGHAYLGEWVNLGALTTNSDLKNDYSAVSVTLGQERHDTKSTKVGAFIGDHAKTSIGTLLNTGSVVGVMAVLLTCGSLMPKSIPSFLWRMNGEFSRGFGRRRLYETARKVMSRRGRQFDDAHQRLYDHVFAVTEKEREQALKRERRTSDG
jgi:UDP-N-acetylglucosamine diphosphorylase/glucosamine-1-phosphate N-acetyltransferase